MKTHIFGELDLNLKLGPDKILKEAIRIAELCGYHVDAGNGVINVGGSDNDFAIITFNEDGIVKKVQHYATDDDWNIIIPVHEVAMA